ncbi:MAG: hypothetical protein D6718_06695, partial [Acidobacteria bacterium]
PGWAPRPAPGAPALIVYTSGTTGDPKGVMLSREGIAENIRASLQRVRCDENDSVLSVLPLFHMLALLANGIGPALLGARTVFLAELDPERILEALREHGITLFACVPLFYYRVHERILSRVAALPPARRAMVRALMRVCRTARRRFGWRLGRRLLPFLHRPFGTTLRMLVTAGAKIDPSVCDDLLDWGFPLVQAYGLTEATAVLTVTPLDELRGDSVGRPIEGVEIAIRDPGPDGVGEILARGPSLMLGYFKDPAATAAALENGWLKTGDLGRIGPDGHLRVTGRAKDVIVLASGKNVYPEELDEHYARSPLVAEICVVGLEDPRRPGAERLHAVVVPDLEEARRRGYVNVREMVTWELESLGRELPPWQRLSGVTFRNSPLPRTATAKVRRLEVKRELQAGGGEARETAAPPAPPADRRGPAGVVFGLLAERAGREQVRDGDHLDLDLGLDSLDRVEVIAEAARRLGVEPPPDIAATAHTAGELAAALRAAPRAGAGANGVASWSERLARFPAEYSPFVSRGPVAATRMLALRCCLRLCAPLAGGLRTAGTDRLPRRGPLLVCPNHTSFLDAPAVLTAMPWRLAARAFFVGYAEYFAGPLGRRIARWVRSIPVDQNRFMERSLQAAAEGLRRGLVLVAFPEGGRSIDGNLGPFRRGPAILAASLGVPLVPVGIAGAYEAWPRGGSWRRHPIAVVFGDPVDPAECGAEVGRLAHRLREGVEEAFAAADRLLRGARGSAPACPR